MRSDRSLVLPCYRRARPPLSRGNQVDQPRSNDLCGCFHQCVGSLYVAQAGGEHRQVDRTSTIFVLDRDDRCRAVREIERMDYRLGTQAPTGVGDCRQLPPVLAPQELRSARRCLMTREGPSQASRCARNGNALRRFCFNSVTCSHFAAIFAAHQSAMTLRLDRKHAPLAIPELWVCVRMAGTGSDGDQGEVASGANKTVP